MLLAIPFSRKEHAVESKNQRRTSSKTERDPSCKVHLVCEGQTPTQNLETRSLSAKEIKTQHKTNSISNQWKSFLGIIHTKVTCKVSSKSHAETQGHCLPHPLQQHLDEAVLFWGPAESTRCSRAGLATKLYDPGNKILSHFRFWADDSATKATNYDEWTHINRI